MEPHQRLVNWVNVLLFGQADLILFCVSHLVQTVQQWGDMWTLSVWIVVLRQPINSACILWVLASCLVVSLSKVFLIVFCPLFLQCYLHFPFLMLMNRTWRYFWVSKWRKPGKTWNTEQNISPKYWDTGYWKWDLLGVPTSALDVVRTITSWPNRQVPSLVPGSKNTSPLIFCPFRIFEHCQATGHNINPPNVKVLFDKNNTIKRRVKEAIAIKQRKPLWIWMRDWTYQQFTVLSTLMKSEWFGWNIRFVSYFFALTFGIFCTN